MTSLVADNPYDMTQQKQFTGFGDVSGQITGGARNGTNWDFMDQQGKVLTSIPYQDFVNNYQSDGSGAVRSGVTSVNGVPVYDFNSKPNAAQPPSNFDPTALDLPADFSAKPGPVKGLVDGAITQSVRPYAQPTTSNAVSPATTTTGAAPQTYTATTSSVNPMTETVAGQVESLLSKDSPLMQRARTLALQNMNQRGLVNSSMAQGAGTAAMIDRITPIAQQDAQTYAARTLANTDATNEANQFNVNQNNQLYSQGLSIAATAKLQADQQTFQSAQAELDRAATAAQQDKSIKAQMDLQTAQQNFQAAQAQLDRTQQSLLSQTQIASNERLTLAQIDATAKNLSTSNQAQMDLLKTQIANNQTEAGKNYAATLSMNATNQINALLADGNLDATAKQAAIDNVIKTTNASLQWASTFYNTSLPSFSSPGSTGSTVIKPGSNMTQSDVNTLIKEAAAQAGGSLSYADAVRAAAKLGISEDKVIAAAQATGVVYQPTASVPAASASATHAPAPSAPAPSAPAASPYSQADVNTLVMEAAAQAGGTLSYQDAVNAANNLGIPVSQIQSAMNSTGVISNP